MDSRTTLRMDMGFYYRDSIKATAQLLIQDPCSVGEPKILTVAHVSYV